MKKTGKMIVEDRDLAFLFLDATDIPEATTATAVEVDIAEDVADWEDEDKAVWLVDETGSKFRVVNRETVWNGDKALVEFETDGFPVPTPVVIADAAAWREHKEEFGF